MSARKEFSKTKAVEIRAALDAQNAANTANEADSQKLETLVVEISEMDARLDIDDLTAIQTLAAKKDQLSRLKTKFAVDSKQRQADVFNQLRDAIDRKALASFFEEQKTALLNSIADKLNPFVKRERAMQMAFSTDAIARINRFIYLCQNSPGLPPVDELLPILDAIAAGRCPWLLN